MASMLESMLNLTRELENEIRIRETVDGLNTKYNLEFTLGDIQFKLTYKIPKIENTKQIMAKEIIDSLVEYMLLNYIRPFE